MAFQIIPAIDVSGGRLARFTTEGPVAVQAFGGDPLDAARALVEGGATWIHVVDVDLAFTGEAGNLDVVSAVASLGVAVQAGGGLSSRADVEAVLEAGAARAVLGPAALADRRTAESLMSSFGDRLVVGVEVEAGRVRPRGRAEVDLGLGETLAWLADASAARFLYTDVTRVGGLDGPDTDAVGGMASALGGPLLVSGGIATAAHVSRLRALGPAVEGAIVGRALLGGVIDLQELLAAAAGGA